MKNGRNGKRWMQVVWKLLVEFLVPVVEMKSGKGIQIKTVATIATMARPKKYEAITTSSQPCFEVRFS